MERNIKIKHAVTAALSLMAFSFHSTSFALGLSDSTIESNLGEALKAHVSILGASDLKDTSCLRLGPGSTITDVNFAVSPMVGNIAKLTLTSSQLINEPIVNFSIIAGCNSTIRRDYVLLLDPPSFNQTSHIETPLTVGNIDTSVDSSTNITENTETVEPSTKTITKKSIKNNKKLIHSASQTEVIATKSSGSKSAVSKMTTEIQAVASQPRFSIAQTTYSAASISGTTLRLDRELRFTPDLNTAAISEQIAIEDEVTVMNKRLTHLQDQINTLLEQNLKLKSENKMQSTQLMLSQKDSSFKLSELLPFLGTSVFLFGSYMVYNWFRRRETLLQTHNTQAIWVNMDTKENDRLDEVIKAKDELFDEVDFDIQESSEDDQLIPNSMESTFEATKGTEDNILIEDDQAFSVLDHADVFLSHGRSSLAIQLLQNHLLEHPKQSVTIWLFLLDLLAKENLQNLYNDTAEECKMHFNVKIAEFSKIDSPSNESLEDFPHLASGLQSVWNTPAAVSYLEDLIYNNRLEPRAGLAKNLVEELVLLRSIAQENVSSAEVIQLDQKKQAINEQKEAMFEARKTEKLREIAEAEIIAKEKAQTDKNETSFEFTLLEK